MKKIKCTNCGESFPVSHEHYESSKMVFNCEFCNARIEKNEEGEWVAVDKRPIPEKQEVQKPEPPQPQAISASPTIGDAIYTWSDRVVTIGWLYVGLSIFLGFQTMVNELVVIGAIAVNAVIVLFITYLVRDLLRALSKHLHNQDKMINELKKGNEGK